MLYVTEMLRWGDTESHHYIVGVYSTVKAATLAGQVEQSWRGGIKYEYQVVAVELDAAVGQEEYEYHFSCKYEESK